VIPGYDGVYGQIVIFPENGEDGQKENAKEVKDMYKRKNKSQKQKSLSDFLSEM
jgi:hypothetical protein